MPNLFVFLMKVNVALLLFCAGYYLVFRHLTFYTLNRVYLVIAILFASAYPKINLSGFMQRHQQIAQPIQSIAFNWQSPAEKFVGPISQPNYWYWVEVVFWAGAALLALRLLAQLYSLYKLYSRSTAGNIYGYDVRVVNGNSGPFSFWKNIYINPENHEQTDLKAILLHEQVHVNEWHTLDILLAELSIIFYWFNPGIWLIKKAIRENIEFITDQKILKTGADSKQYQYSLLSVSFTSSSNTIVNHFNLSTIKKRIIMMNAKRSSKANLTRYAFLVPVVIALLLVFSISKAALVKNENVYKTIAATIDKIGGHVKTNNTTKPTIALDSKSVMENAIVKTPSFKTGDTIRKGDVFINTAASSDSLIYVINGKKVTKADFKALDSDQIYAIEIVPGEKAAKILDNVDTKHDVLFVTTNDSESGKKFKEKLDKLNGMDNVTIKGFSKNGDLGSTIPSGDGTSTSAETVNTSVVGGSDIVGVVVSPKLYKLRTKHLVAGKYIIDTLTSIKNGQPMVTDEGPDSTRVFALSVGKGVYTIKPKYKTLNLNIKPKLAYKNLYKYNNAYQPKAYTVISADVDNEANIEHLPEKMIMIDGKEATERQLKKLSAADIESMSVKSGDDITKQYGDKAKNGVVFISTKKAKK